MKLKLKLKKSFVHSINLVEANCNLCKKFENLYFRNLFKIKTPQSPNQVDIQRKEITPVYNPNLTQSKKVGSVDGARQGVDIVRVLVGFNAVGITRGASGGGAGRVTDLNTESAGDERRGLEQVDRRQIPVENLAGLGVFELQNAVADFAGGHLDGDTTAVGVGQPTVAIEGLARGEGLHLTLSLGDNPQVDGLLEVVDDAETGTGSPGGTADSAGAESAGASGNAGDGDAGCARDIDSGNADGRNGGSIRRNGNVLGGEDGRSGLRDGRSGGLIDGLVNSLPHNILDGLNVANGDREGSSSGCQEGREANDVEAHFRLGT